MKKSELKTIINEAIGKVAERERLKARIRKVISEEVKQMKKSVIKEDNDEKEGASIKAKRDAVMQLLRSDYTKYSEFAYRLWPDIEKSTARSLFSKKVSGEPDNDGNVRKFDDQEISDLYMMLRTI